MSEERLRLLAREHGYVSGKWIAFVPPDQVDRAWQTLGAAVVEGDRPNNVTAIKVRMFTLSRFLSVRED